MDLNSAGQWPNVFVPETTGHVQRSCGVHEGNLHDIRLVVLMLFNENVYIAGDFIG